MSIYDKLLKCQLDLKAPKNAYNSFGKYKYRSCEDILEGLKPVLKKYNATLTILDEIVQIGERYYIKATATLVDIETGDSIQNVAFAREEFEKKGMDSSQVTGATSSYARKYALNGLFLIDDTKDSDNYDNEKTDEQLNKEMEDSVDKTMIPSKGPITKEHIEKIRSEMQRTGIDEKVILSTTKTPSIESMTDVQAVAILNRFAKSKDKKT